MKTRSLNLASLAKRAGLGLTVFALALLEQIKTTGHLPRTGSEWGLDAAAAGLSMIPAGADRTGVGSLVKSALKGAQTVLTAPADARKQAADAQVEALLAQAGRIAEQKALTVLTGQYVQTPSGLMLAGDALAQGHLIPVVTSSPAASQVVTPDVPRGAAPLNPSPANGDAAAASGPVAVYDDHLVSVLENEGGPAAS